MRLPHLPVPINVGDDRGLQNMSEEVVLLVDGQASIEAFPTVASLSMSDVGTTIGQCDHHPQETSVAETNTGEEIEVLIGIMVADGADRAHRMGEVIDIAAEAPGAVIWTMKQISLCHEEIPETFRRYK